MRRKDGWLIEATSAVDRHNLGGLTYPLENVSKANLPAEHRDLDIPVKDIIPGIDVLLAQQISGRISVPWR